MKILLIWPPSPEYCVLTEEFSCCEPLGLEYIAASVSNEHHVEIIDMRFDRNLVEILKTTKPDIVGVSIPFTVVVNVCNDLLKTIKGLYRRREIRSDAWSISFPAIWSRVPTAPFLDP
jgi:methyltransferase